MISDHEFTLGRHCPMKTLHARAGLPRNNGCMTAWLRRERRELRALAELLFPEAIRVSSSHPGGAEAATVEMITAGTAVKDGRLSTESCCCDVDFLVPQGDTLRLYQVVPRILDLEEHRRQRALTGSRGKPHEKWRAHLILLTFRLQIVRILWPKHRVLPFLVVPIKGQKCKIEGLHGFYCETEDRWVHPAAKDEAFRLLKTVCVAEECDSLVKDVAREVDRLEAWLQAPRSPVLGYSCKNCEFRLEGEKSGFEACWGPLAEVNRSLKNRRFSYRRLWFRCFSS